MQGNPRLQASGAQASQKPGMALMGSRPAAGGEEGEGLALDVGRRLSAFTQGPCRIHQEFFDNCWGVFY